jgi:hypothetical protein
MGQDPKYKIDDIVGCVALLLVLLGIVIMIVVTRP